MSHYETLGVDKAATPADIKAARRRKASEAHPDKGGSDEAMQKVNHAYAVLSDPKARARYDDTGDDGSSGNEPSPAVVATDMLRQLFTSALAGGAVNIVKAARKALKVAESNLKAEEVDATHSIRRLEARRKKVRVKGDKPNLAHQVLDGQLAQHRTTLQKVDFARKVNAVIAVMVDDYEDDEEEPSPFDPFSDARNRYSMGKVF